MSPSRWRLAIVVAVLASTLAAVYVASLVTSESLYSRRGSIAYWLTVSRVIRDVPEIYTCNCGWVDLGHASGPYQLIE
jgi:hypothetical protein